MKEFMKEHRAILIYADGNPDIATGHLMRCLSIADALRSLGADAEFAVSDETSRVLLSSFFREEEGYPIHVLHADYRKPEGSLAALTRLLDGGHPVRPVPGSRFCCLLIDSYFVTEAFLEALRPLVRTAFLDDLYAFDYPVDLVINYDFAPPESFYTKAGKKLLGCRFTPLRAQFAGLSPVFRKEVGDLLISTGGTDAYDVAGRLASSLLASSGSVSWRIHVLTGTMHSCRAKLEALAASHPQLLLHENVKDMAALMGSCDLAVSAAGTTLYELCAAGVPAVSFTLADNQLPCARDMQRFAGVPYAGDARNAPELIDTLSSLLFSLAENPGKRGALARSMHASIDGRGAARIARGLLAL